MRAVVFAALIAVAAAVHPGCSCGDSVAAATCDGGPCPPPDGGGDACAVVCGGGCCGAGESCIADRCVATQPPCASDEECQNDTCCQSGICEPYGAGTPCGVTNASCTKGLKIGIFAPVTRCEWTALPTDDYPAHGNVLGTPAVIDFHFGGQSGHPSIVFVSYNGDDTDMPSCSNSDPAYYGVIRVIDGATCAQQYTIAAPRVLGAAPVALADLDGDGRAEIVAMRAAGGVVAFRYDATADAFREAWDASVYTDYGSGMCWWSGPSIHDLDDDGLPEIMVGGAIWDHTGQLLGGPYDCSGADAAEAYCTLLSDNLRPDYDGIGQIPVIARLGDAAVATLIDGANLWQLDSGTGRWQAQTTGLGRRGQIALADFGTFGASAAGDDRGTLDGVPEIVVVSNANATPDSPATAQGELRIMTLAGRVVFGPVTLAGAGLGGPPTIGDFDGDGRAEVAVAGWHEFTVYDPDCAGPAPSATTCASGATNGVLWSRPSQDQTSSSTGSSIFDFDGDGQAEVIYADECFARVYDGRSGDVLYSQFHNSATWYEHPIVADTDGDGRAELVIPSNTAGQIACPLIDPIFDGIRCKEPQDCPNLLPCVKSLPTDAAGLCRCQADSDCGGAGFVCGDPASQPAQGQVCRASHPGSQVQGVRVIADRLARWVAARPVWNQHAYSITNVDDVGAIPRTSGWQRNWLVSGYNNFRQNVPGTAPGSTSLPDLTVRQARGACGAASGATLSAEVCNRGTLAADPVYLTFAATAPEVVVACVTQASAPLAPGDCVTLSCEWPAAPLNVVIDLTARANDPGDGSSAIVECIQGNDLDYIENLICGQLG